jgi:hypothetical protein
MTEPPLSPRLGGAMIRSMLASAGVARRLRVYRMFFAGRCSTPHAPRTALELFFGLGLSFSLFRHVNILPRPS